MHALIYARPTHLVKRKLVEQFCTVDVFLPVLVDFDGEHWADSSEVGLCGCECSSDWRMVHAAEAQWITNEQFTIRNIWNPKTKSNLLECSVLMPNHFHAHNAIAVACTFVPIPPQALEQIMPGWSLCLCNRSQQFFLDCIVHADNSFL